MTEAFLHHAWKYRLFRTPSLETLTGDTIEILKPGLHNHHAGPDFFNARIRIGETIWAGNVEIHIRASDWYRHNHETDRSYDNIVLHVVYDADVPVKRNNGIEIPVLELK